ncbi:MAG: hypothetical protein AUG83_08215 [Acidobacteria bacterium 13_1_20CM_4_57_11]|nr:MAG: hypothetical protein AUG83_08215 [Acidobacteria bacterium 13_1_20CM_4_57_11]
MRHGKALAKECSFIKNDTLSRVWQRYSMDAGGAQRRSGILSSQTNLGAMINTRNANKNLDPRPAHMAVLFGPGITHLLLFSVLVSRQSRRKMFIGRY